MVSNWEEAYIDNEKMLEYKMMEKALLRLYWHGKSIWGGDT